MQWQQLQSGLWEFLEVFVDNRLYFIFLCGDARHLKACQLTLR